VETSSFRILIADNFEPWRRYVSSTLEKDQSLEIVGMASDGFEAVQKAIELKPDLVLLSVGLFPQTNGIEAAKRIIKAVPGVKLLFATQIIDPDVMTEALRNGAHGYITKMDAQRELLPAIRAILRGEKFIGDGM
jgi:two-component system, NarL family, nitrate/nitrite response regulator NarL